MVRKPAGVAENEQLLSILVRVPSQCQRKCRFPLSCRCHRFPILTWCRCRLLHSLAHNPQNSHQRPQCRRVSCNSYVPISETLVPS